MGYWTIDGILDSKKKKGKKDKEGKKDKVKVTKENSKKNQDTDTKGMTYSELLKAGAEGLYVAETKIDDDKVETCIIKSKEFQYPKVAISDDAISYKDWLAEKIKDRESNMNVNKAMYNSKVRKVDVPKRFVHQLIEKLEDSE